MSQFNPNMSKEQLVNDFRAVDPSYNSMSDDLAYRMIVRKFPQYKLNSETQQYTPKDESGIIDKLGDVWKDGYNRSLQGMVYEITQGKKKYDLGNYHPGLVSDIAAGVASFFQPLDFATTLAGGGLGGAATKAVATKYVTKKLIQNGAKPKVAQRAARMAVKSNALPKVATASAGGAGALGLYSGAGEALNEYISDGTVTPGKVVKAGAKGAVLGGMTGATNAYLTQKGVGVLGRTLAEVAEFGTVSPALEGRTPTTEDWIHAGGMILGIKGVNTVASKGFKKLNEFRKEATKQEITYETAPSDLDLTIQSKEIARRTYETELRDNIYVDNQKQRRKVKILSTNPEEGKVQFRFTDTNEVVVRDTKFFNQNYRKENYEKLSPKELKEVYSKEIRKMEKELGHDSTQKETNRGLRKASEGKKALPKTLRENSNGYLSELHGKLTTELYTKQVLNHMEKNGIPMQKARYSIFLDNILPKPANKLLDIVRPARNQGTVSPIRRIYVAKVDQFVVDQRRTLSETYDLMSEFGFNTEKPTKAQIERLSNAIGINKSEVSSRYWELLSDAVEKGIDIKETRDYKQISDFLFNRAKESGVDVGYLQNYIPRILKQGLAEKVFADIYKISEFVSKESARSGEEMMVKNLKSDYIDLIIQAMNNPNEFIKNRGGEANFLNRVIRNSISSLSKETREAYDEILEGVKKRDKLEELSPFKAMALMGRLTYGEVFKLDGNLEKSRTYELPSNFYEKDIRKLLGIYSSNVARRSAEVKNFGRKGEIYENLLNNLKGSESDLAIMRELHNHVMGTIGYNRRYNLNPGIKDFMQKVMEWETSTKIALGTATAMNLSQFAISSALSAGYWRFTKGCIWW